MTELRIQDFFKNNLGTNSTDAVAFGNPNEVYQARNVEMIKFGSDRVGFTTRPGVEEKYDASSSNSFTAIHHYIKRAATDSTFLCGAYSTVVYDFSNSANVKTGLTSGAEMTITSFNNSMIFGNGAEAMQKWEGTGASGDLAGSPPAGNILAVFNDHLWIAGIPAQPLIVAPSGQGDEESWSALHQIRMIHGDATKVTAMIPYKSELAVFTDRNIQSIYGYSHIDFSRDIKSTTVGCVGKDAVCGANIPEVGELLFFCANDGVYITNLTTDGTFKISDRIQPLWNELTASAKTKIRMHNDRNKMQVIVAVPGDGNAYNDMCFVYDYKNKSWLIWDGLYLGCFTDYLETGENTKVYAGSSKTDGLIYEVNNDDNEDDNGTAIEGYVETMRYDGGNPGVYKLWDKIVLYLKARTTNESLDVKVKNEYDSSYYSIGQINYQDSGDLFGTGVFGTAVFGGVECIRWELPLNINKSHHVSYRFENIQAGEKFTVIGWEHRFRMRGAYG